jgi:hypothetical protein
MFMFFAGIVTIIQGARMKPFASTTAASTRMDISDSGSHYTTGLGIKKDPRIRELYNLSPTVYHF